MPGCLGDETIARALGDHEEAQRYLDRAVAVSAHADDTAQDIEMQDLVANGLRNGGKLDESLRILEPLAAKAEANARDGLVR